MSNLSALWKADSVAIIGATERVGAMGRAPVEYLKRYGYRGKIYPINPKGGSILDIPAFANIRDVKEPIELALVMVPASAVKEAVEDCAHVGVKVVIVMSSGFAEADDDGAIAQNELVEIAKGSGMRLVGPNCIGSIGGANGLIASFSPVFSSTSTRVDAGSIALVSQSGALGYGMYSLGMERGIPIGSVITTGNEGDVSAIEVAAALSNDPAVSAILLYTESLTDIDTLREISQKKPTAILKVGRSAAGALAAASHTGALATEDKVIDAAINSTSAVRVNDVEQLLDAGLIFSSGVKPLGKRIAIITTSGGSGILATDAIEVNGLELATFSDETLHALSEIVPSYGNIQNPVDVTAAVMSSPNLFEKCLEVLARDPGVDAIVACFAVLVGADVNRIANALGEVKNIRNLPIAVARTGSQDLAPEANKLFREMNLPIYPTPDRAVSALRLLNDSNRESRKIPSSATGAYSIPTPSASEVELKAIWSAAGVSVPLSQVITSAGEVLPAIEMVGGRSVMKAIIPGLLHKSEAGGVALDITAANGAKTYERLSQLAGPGTQNSVLIETFVPKGVECLVGVTPSSLGKVLTIGVGGILTEIISDVSVRLLPVDERVIHEMISETRLKDLFAGPRGSEPSDVKTFVSTVLKISEVVKAWPSESELDINPLTVLPQGVFVLDSAYTSGAHTEGNHN